MSGRPGILGVTDFNSHGEWRQRLAWAIGVATALGVLLQGKGYLYGLAFSVQENLSSMMAR